MTSTDHLKSHALSGTHDFYDLLNLSPGAQETELRRAYRKTALKYHPDKVGPSNTEALERFHLLQIAYDVLSDPVVRELYDNARRAKEEKKQREAAYEGRRQWMREDLEARERGALKRRRDDTAAEVEFETELSRIAEDGKRRRKEREEQLRKEALELEEEDRKLREGVPAPQTTPDNAENDGPSDMDRSITFRFPKDASQHTQSTLEQLWSTFGPIDHCLLRETRIKVPGEKHRKDYVTTVIVYKSIVGAHAAISDISKLQSSGESGKWTVFEVVGWAGGKEPDSVPKMSRTDASGEGIRAAESAAQNSKPLNGGKATAVGGTGARKPPSFTSFKPNGSNRLSGGASLDENLMMRLKNAHRKREEQQRMREAQAAEQ